MSRPKISNIHAGGNISLEDGELTPLPRQPSPKRTSWSDIVSKDSKKNLSLSFFPPAIIDGNTVIKPPDAIIQKGINAWSSSLVGSFIHSKLPFKLVEAAAFKLWGNLGLSKVLLHSDGYFIFKFNTIEEKDHIISLGPWHIASKPLFLKSWKEGVNFQDLTCCSIPIWAKISNIPLSYWTAEGLGYIASGLGSPLFADEATSKLDPLPFARICIDMEASSPFPSFLNVCIPDHSSGSQKQIKVNIEYQGKPPLCPTCKTFGHSHLKCPKSNYVWVPKLPDPPTTSEKPLLDPSSSGPSTHSSPLITSPTPIPHSSSSGPSTHSSPLITSPTPISMWTTVPAGPPSKTQTLPENPIPLKNDFALFSPTLIPDSLDQLDCESPIPYNPIIDKLKGVDEKDIKDQKLHPSVGNNQKSSKRKKKGSPLNPQTLPN